MAQALRSADQWIAIARAAFQAEGIADPAGDARRLVGSALGMSPTKLITEGGRRIADPAEERQLAAWIARRLRREPVHRIMGARQFYGLDLLLSAETLEPRPDTEVLVDTVLDAVGRLFANEAPLRILDLGTGTGAIALAIVANCTRASAVAVDISADALDTAMRNAQLNGLEARFSVVQSDWYAGVSGRFDIIVSNPPYIPSTHIADLDPEVSRFDPPVALDGGADGLDAYRLIAAGACDVLSQGGLVAVEIGWDQRTDVTAIFVEHGYFPLETVRDYGGNERALLFCEEKR